MTYTNTHPSIEDMAAFIVVNCGLNEMTVFDLTDALQEEFLKAPQKPTAMGHRRQYLTLNCGQYHIRIDRTLKEKEGRWLPAGLYTHVKTRKMGMRDVQLFWT